MTQNTSHAVKDGTAIRENTLDILDDVKQKLVIHGHVFKMSDLNIAIMKGDKDAILKIHAATPDGADSIVSNQILEWARDERIRRIPRTKAHHRSNDGHN